MRGAPAARRPAIPVSRAMGTMVAPGHPQDDSPQLPRPRQETRLTGRCPNQPDTRLLLPRASRPHQQAGSGTARLRALAACMSRVPRRVARTVLRGPGAATRQGYPADGRALRTETVVNDAYGFGCDRLLHNLDELQARTRDGNRRLLHAERAGQGCVPANPVFERIAHPTACVPPPCSRSPGRHCQRPRPGPAARTAPPGASGECCPAPHPPRRHYPRSAAATRSGIRPPYCPSGSRH